MVKTELVRIGIDDAEKLWKMQVKAFSENHKDKHNSKAKYGWYRYDTSINAFK